LPPDINNLHDGTPDANMITHPSHNNYVGGNSASEHRMSTQQDNNSRACTPNSNIVDLAIG